MHAEYYTTGRGPHRSSVRSSGRRPAGHPVPDYLAQARREVRRVLQARYDAAQTSTGNENHWAAADNLDPHNAASAAVRRKLRSRSRYEVIENNPFLKGVLLTICNDFVGKRGPRLKITDSRLTAAIRKAVQQKWRQWSRQIKLRKKLWRLRLAKMVDGEGFARAYNNRRLRSPVRLDFHVLEADRISSSDPLSISPKKDFEVDGVRFDRWEQPTAYHVLNQHPGGSGLFTSLKASGQWERADNMVHWFRQDRGWLRGVPETTPSLPLCAILRRYTLAMLRWAETQADMTLLLETEAPAGASNWQNPEEDWEPDIFPVEMGMAMTLPWGTKPHQLNPVPLGAQYDDYVGSLLREITRPLLMPFNLTVGTSKDSNMASAIVDQHIYKQGQSAERSSCEEDLLDQTLFPLWLAEAARIEGYFLPGLTLTVLIGDDLPDHEWRWDRIGLDHTDPLKVAKSLESLGPKGSHYLTDEDIQEEYFNRDVDDWREEVEQDRAFRRTDADDEPAGATDDDDPEEEDDEA